MYNGILELEISADAMSSPYLVAYADDVVAIIIALNTEFAQPKLNQVMRRASGWLDERGLQLATQKTEIVVLKSKRIDTLFLMTVLGEGIMTKGAIKYLVITLNTKLTFFPHIKAASDKSSRVTTVLSGLMSNISGAKQSKRRLLMSVVHSNLLYGAEVWAIALKFEFYRHGTQPYREPALYV